MVFGRRQLFDREVRARIVTEILGGRAFYDLGGDTPEKRAERLFVDAVRDLFPDVMELHQPIALVLDADIKAAGDGSTSFIQRFLAWPDFDIAPLAAIYWRLNGNPDEADRALKFVPPERIVQVKSWLDRADSLAELTAPKTADWIDLRREIGGLSILEWVRQHGTDPELWHMLAHQYSDDLLPSYEWIVNHPDCDAGTAAMLFHVLNAYEYYEKSPEMLDELRRKDIQFRIVETAVQRWLGSHFKTNRLTIYEMGYEESIQGYENRVKKAVLKYGASILEFVPEMFVFDKGVREQTAFYFEV